MYNLIRIAHTDLNRSHVEWTLRDHFNLKVFVVNENYDNKKDILVITRKESCNKEILIDHLERGFKLILATLWEARPFFLSSEFEPYLDNVLVVLGCKTPFKYGWKHVIAVPNWFWYNESLWYTCDLNFQYQNYIPNRTNGKLFFMPIKRSKVFRDQIVDRIDNFLDQAVWSYAERWNNGRHLPTRAVNPVARIAWDRQFEEEWYNDTYFSLVVETAYAYSNPNDELDGILNNDKVPCELFVTEKTFKPIAFQHPFMVCGMPGVLEFIKNNGFETYDHIFDEGYDNLDFFEDRLECIYNNIENFDVKKYNDPLTKQKIQHNYTRFYDRALVLDGIKKELIEPMENFLESK